MRSFVEVHPETFGKVSLFQEHVFSSGSTIIECIRVCVSLLPLVENTLKGTNRSTYPTFGKGKSSSKVLNSRVYDMLVPWRVDLHLPENLSRGHSKLGILPKMAKENLIVKVNPLGCA